MIKKKNKGFSTEENEQRLWLRNSLRTRKTWLANEGRYGEILKRTFIIR